MLGELITSKTRLRLLIKFFISQANRGYLNGLATEMGESSNAIRKELNHLHDAGYLDKVKNDNKVEYQANIKHPLFDILRKVVTEEEGTASLADVFGYNVGGKTGTSENYHNKKENLNTFISVFPSQNPKYVLLVMLENPQVAEDLIYDYRGLKIKASRNEAGWNSVYVSGKIIKKIGPILAIKDKDFNSQYVAEKVN